MMKVAQPKAIFQLLHILEANIASHFTSAYSCRLCVNLCNVCKTKSQEANKSISYRDGVYAREVL